MERNRSSIAETYSRYRTQTEHKWDESNRDTWPSLAKPPWMHCSTCVFFLLSFFYPDVCTGYLIQRSIYWLSTSHATAALQWFIGLISTQMCIDMQRTAKTKEDRNRKGDLKAACGAHGTENTGGQNKMVPLYRSVKTWTWGDWNTAILFVKADSKQQGHIMEGKWKLLLCISHLNVHKWLNLGFTVEREPFMLGLCFWNGLVVLGEKLQCETP